MNGDSGSLTPDSMDCACVADDAYDCWRDRYDMNEGEDSATEVELDGGPCRCSCHDSDWDEEEDQL